MKKIILFVFLIFAFQPFGFSQQIEELPSDPQEFIKALDKFMNATKRTECEEAFATFKKAFTTKSFTDDQYNGIRDVMNVMLKHKMLAYPYFVDYLRVVKGISSNEYISKKYFADWLRIALSFITDLKPSKNLDYSLFLNLSDDLFNHNCIYYSESGHQWKLSSQDWRLVYENARFRVDVPMTNLYGIRKTDTIEIQKTSGSFSLDEQKWTGTSGKVDWSRTGLKGVSCTFNNYSVVTKESGYRVVKSVLNYPALFSQPVEGSFEDKIIISHTKGYSAQFPRFESFNKSLFVKDIAPDVEYRGGFRLIGQDISGFGDKNVQSEIRLYDKNHKLVTRALSLLFNIKKRERIVAENAEVSIYFGSDSIYHPGIELRYDIHRRRLKLAQGSQGRSKTPFFNSFQMVEMFVTTLEWNIDQPNLEIGKGDAGTISRKEVLFESLSMFDLKRYERYHNIGSYNDIAKIVTFWRNVDAYRRILPMTDPQKLKIRRIIEKDLDGLVSNMDDLLRECDSLRAGERKLKAGRIAYMLNKKFDVTSIGRMLNDMVEDGFIFYDPETKWVELREKLFHYNDASINKVDFDRIQVKSAYNVTLNSDANSANSQYRKYGYEELDTTSSEGARVNGVLDMRKGLLNASWVQKLLLSDKQKVFVEPDGKGHRIQMNKNRDMEFSGKVNAGMCTMDGVGFHFSYSNFEMKMDSVNFMAFKVIRRAPDPDDAYFYTPYPETDANGAVTTETQYLTTRIQNLKGILLIDAPNNKSGREDIKVFPSFECTSNSYAYYDDPKIRKGNYKKDKFYFELDTFIRDTLDDFNPDYLKFKGKFVSGGIFPEMRQTLRVMWHDLSLGFEAETPQEGLPIYNGKGKFNKYFGLSNMGLIGNGVVEYLGSKFKSDDIIFLPDSMLATSSSFNIAESRGEVQFPKVEGDSVILAWHPAKDSMYVRSAGNKPFNFFKSPGYTLSGLVILTPGGLYGDGVFDWEQATMKSRKFHFGANKVESDSTQMSIKGQEDKQVVFRTENVKANIDFDTQLGKFKSNTNKITSELPYNSFKTSMDDFAWNMKTHTLHMVAANQKNGFFLATRKDMDSLMFTGTTADCNLKTNSLNVDGVEFIPCADAYIYTSDKHVSIGANGEIDTLRNAKIIADTVNHYHTISRAIVKVLGRNKYTADGYLEYNLATKSQEIRFNNVSAVKKGKHRYITHGSGNVDEDVDFLVDTKTKFFGSVELSADSKNLMFKGFAKLNTNKIPKTSWFSIKSPIDRKKVEITYNTPHTPEPENKKVYTGIYYTKHDTAELYTLLMRPKILPPDRAMFECRGVMSYNDAEDKFLFKDSSYIIAKEKHGNLITAYDGNGKFKAEGEFLFGAQLGTISLTTAGYIESNLDKMDYTFYLSAGLKMTIPDVLTNMIIADLSKGEMNNNIKYTFSQGHSMAQYKRALQDIIKDDKRADKIMEKLTDNDKMDIGPDLGYTFYFPKFDLQWVEKQSTFFTKGPLAIATIKGAPINQDLRGCAEVFPAGRGDKLTFYFDTTEGVRYFFSYSGNVLQTYSINEAYNTAVAALKKKDKEIKLPNGDVYTIELGTSAQMTGFVKRSQDR